jgi:hypothetical protein
MESGYSFGQRRYFCNRVLELAHDYRFDARLRRAALADFMWLGKQMPAWMTARETKMGAEIRKP